MGVYLIIATFLYMGIFIKKEYQSFYYKVSLIILFMFTAFRDINLGGYDAENYQRFFYFQVPKLNNILNYSSDYAYGYAFFNSVIKSIAEDYRVYQVVYSLLAIVLLNSIIKKSQFTKWERNLFLFIYFCYRFLWNNFVLLRQNIAVLVFWILILDVFDKSIKSYLRTGIAWLWHKSALVNIVIYPFVRRMRKAHRNRLFFITIVVSVLFLVLSKPVFNMLIRVFLMLAGSKFEKYALITSDTEGINFVNYVLKWVFVLIFYSNYNKIKNPHKAVFLNMSFIAMIIGSINIGFVGRLVEYYMISIYAIIPISHQAFQGREKYLYVLGLYFVFIFILFRFLYTFSGGELLNYSTFFS